MTTSIPFYKQITHFTQFLPVFSMMLSAALRRCFFGSYFRSTPLQGILVPHWITHILHANNPMATSIPFYKQTTQFTQFLGLFYPKNGNFEVDKKWEKWTPPNGVDRPPIHIHKPTAHFTQLLNMFSRQRFIFPHDTRWCSSSALPSSGHRVVLVEVVSTWHTYQCVLYTFVVILIPNSP